MARTYHVRTYALHDGSQIGTGRYLTAEPADLAGWLIVDRSAGHSHVVAWDHGHACTPREIVPPYAVADLRASLTAALGA